MRFPTRDPRWPLMGGMFFQVAAALQIVEILVRRDAAAVSAASWGLSALILAGYVDFYRIHMSPEARRSGIAASLISATLYSIIVALTFVF